MYVNLRMHMMILKLEDSPQNLMISFTPTVSLSENGTFSHHLMCEMVLQNLLCKHKSRIRLELVVINNII